MTAAFVHGNPETAAVWGPLLAELGREDAAGRLATRLEGLDRDFRSGLASCERRELVTSHAAFAYRDTAGVLRVLHAPLSGGVVEVTSSTLHDYVRAIRRATGILIARPLPG